jgi:hypothetical protein
MTTPKYTPGDELSPQELNILEEYVMGDPELRKVAMQITRRIHTKGQQFSVRRASELLYRLGRLVSNSRNGRG